MAGNFGDSHIYTVLCPSCNRPWTGEFLDTNQEKVVCKDCIMEGEGKASESADVHISKKRSMQQR